MGQIFRESFIEISAHHVLYSVILMPVQDFMGNRIHRIVILVDEYLMGIRIFEPF